MRGRISKARTARLEAEARPPATDGYAHPFVTVDVVILTLRGGRLQALGIHHAAPRVCSVAITLRPQFDASAFAALNESKLRINSARSISQ